MAARWQRAVLRQPRSPTDAVEIKSTGPAIEAGVPKALFDVRISATFVTGNGFGGTANSPYPYVASRDGERFLVSVDTALLATEAPLTVVANCQAGFRK